MSSKSSGKRLEGFFTGKGFYIVLFLCAAVIGLSAWMMAAGNEAMEEARNFGEVGLDNRRIETVIITPEVKPQGVEAMAIPEEQESLSAEPVEEEMPAGQWKLTSDGQKYEGGQTVKVKAPIDYMPVFEKL